MHHLFFVVRGDGCEPQAFNPIRYQNCAKARAVALGERLLLEGFTDVRVEMRRRAEVEMDDYSLPPIRRIEIFRPLKPWLQEHVEWER